MLYNNFIKIVKIIIKKIRRNFVFLFISKKFNLMALNILPVASKNGEGEIHFRIITADTGISWKVTGISWQISTNTSTNTRKWQIRDDQ